MSKIITIDCDYVMPGVACAYLIIDNSRAVFVENNTSHSIPILLNALRKEGLEPESVDYAIITHVHLDHAGGSGVLLKECPNATLLAHPKASRHMVDPSRLVSSARQVYGEEFDSLYGEILPVPEERVRIMGDGEKLPWQSRNFEFIYTRGHANHHFCIYDSLSNGVFTGDSFGIAYPELSNDQSFIFPTTTPTDFDPEEALLSLDKILNTGADKVYLTHFGEVGNLQSKKDDLVSSLEFFSNLCEEGKSSDISTGEIQDFMENKVRTYLYKLAESKGIELNEKRKKMLEFDVVLNSQGLAYRVSKLKKQ